MKSILLFFLLLVQCADGANWYVDNAASGSNNGTSWANAWQTFSAVNWASVSAGDTVYISGGTTSKTYTEQMTPTKGGTAGNPITISRGVDANHNGQVILEGANTRAIGFRLDYDHLTLDGVTGDAVAGNTNYGIKVQNLYQHAGGNSYGVYGNAGQSYTHVFHVEFYGTNTLSSDDNASGIYLGGGGNNYVLGWNWVHGPIVTYANRTQKWRATGITMFPNLTGVDYTNNFAFSNKVNNLYHDGIRGSHNTTLAYNDVRDIDGGGHSDSLLIQSGSNAKVVGNYVESNDQAVYLDNLGATTQSNVWIYNNVILGTVPSGSSGLAAWFSLDPEGGNWNIVNIFNNTCWNQTPGTGGYCLRGDGRGSATAVTNLRMINNIFCQSGAANPLVALSTDNTVADSSALDYNAYTVASGNIVGWTDGANKTLSQLQALSPARETHGKYGTPTWTSANTNGDFTLTSGDTVARDSGVDLSAYFTTDKAGNTRSGTWDLGAFEYDSSGDVTAPTCVISSPASVSSGGSGSYSTSSSTITVSGTSDDATATVTWSNSRGGAGTATGSTSWSQAGITLASGGNVLTFTATDPSANFTTTTLNVTYTVPAVGGTTNNVGTLRIY